MPSLQDLLNFSQQQPAQQSYNVTPAAGWSTAQSPGQTAWMAHAKQQVGNMNSMPYVLDPNRLTNNQASNTSLMYPDMLQQCGVPRVVAGEKNIGLDLANKAPAADFSGVTSIDDIAARVAKITGMSDDAAKSWVQSLLPAFKTDTASNAGSDTSGGLANNAWDMARYNGTVG